MDPIYVTNKNSMFIYVIIFVTILIVAALVYNYMIYKLNLKWSIEIVPSSDSEEIPSIEFKIKELNKDGHIKYKILRLDPNDSSSSNIPKKYEDFTGEEINVESIIKDDDENLSDITYTINNNTDGANTLEPGNRYKMYFIFRDVDNNDSDIKKSRELVINNVCRSATTKPNGTTNCPHGYVENPANKHVLCSDFTCEVEERSSVDFSTCCCKEGDTSCNGIIMPIELKIYSDNGKFDLRAKYLLKQRNGDGRDDYYTKWLTLFAHVANEEDEYLDLLNENNNDWLPAAVPAKV